MNPNDYRKGDKVIITAKSHKNKTGTLTGRYGNKLSVCLDDAKDTRCSYLTFDAVDLKKYPLSPSCF